jgi:hypothetical protein
MAIFTRAQSNPQFPQNLPNPNFQFQDIGPTLDSVFDAYMRSRQDDRAAKLSGLQTQVLQGQLANQGRESQMADVRETAQFGSPLASFSPQQITQAGAGMEAPGMLSPEKVASFNRLREGLARLGGRDPQTLAAQGLKTREAEADIAFKQERAEALSRGQVFVNPDTGQTVQAPAGAKLIPRAPSGKGILKNDDQLAAFNLYETARDGLISGLSGSETGPIVGRVPAFTTEQQVAEGGVAAMAPVLKQLFRVSGEGVFTDRDQQLLLDMVPTRKDRPEAREQKIKNIDNIVKAKLRISGDGGNQAGNTPESIRAAFKAGRITREQAKAQIAALGGIGGR